MSLSSTDITFVNETAAKAYECGICLEILKAPVAICDDHLFCQACVIQLIQREGDNFRCPNCRKICNVLKIKRTKFVDRRLGELIVKCPNHQLTRQKALYLRSLHNIRRKSNYNKNSSAQSRSRSRSRDRKNIDGKSGNVNNKENSVERCSGIQLCKWTGPYSDLGVHINQCKLHIIKCPYCPVLMMRKDEVNHHSKCVNYPIPCKFCDMSIPRTKMNDHLIRYCQSWIVNCKICKTKMKRGEIINHRDNECPESLVRCKYSAYGCEKILKRKDEKEHMEEGMKEHLKFVTQSHDKMRNDMRQLQNKVNGLEQSVEQIRDVNTNRLDDLEQKYTTLLDCIMDHGYSG